MSFSSFKHILKNLKNSHFEKSDRQEEFHENMPHSGGVQKPKAQVIRVLELEVGKERLAIAKVIDILRGVMEGYPLTAKHNEDVSGTSFFSAEHQRLVLIA